MSCARSESTTGKFKILIIVALIISLCSLGTTIYLTVSNIVPVIYVHMGFSDILLLAETIVLAATLLALVYQIAVQRKELREASKSRQGSFLFEVFKSLSTDNARKDRSFVYSDSLPKPNTTLSNDEWNIINRVWSQLDQLGLFIERGLIEEDVVMELYWDVIIKCWDKLKGHLEAERKRRGYDMFQKYFEILAKRALEYKKEHYPKQNIEYYKVQEQGGVFF